MDNLIKMGFIPVASFTVEKKQYIIEMTHNECLDWEKSIYIHTIDEQIIRIGSSKNKLKIRFRSWERGVTKALEFKASSTPMWEAMEWERLLENKKGILYAKKGDVLQTSVGEISTYLSEESYLIGKYLPKLNRSKHR
tara:strand:- start:2318 stop:2731 length:414 start_codon:yes stop_codon:yes gene_type:complete